MSKVTYRRRYSFAMLVLHEEELAIMDTVFFEMAMTEWEKQNGKKCIVGVITSTELSQLLQRAQELKSQNRENVTP